MYCPNCGKEKAEEAQFCTSCGYGTQQQAPAAQPDATQPMAPPPTPPGAAPPPAPAGGKGGNTTYVIIGCVALLLVVLLGVGGYFGVKWWRSRNAPPPEPVTQTQTQTDDEPEVVDTDEDEPSEGGVHTEDEDQAREFVMDLFSMWAQGDGAGIRAVASPSMLTMTEDYNFDDAYEQYGVEIVSAYELDEGKWGFNVAETYDAGDGERETTEYRVWVERHEGGMRVILLSRIDAEEDVDGDGGDEGGETIGGTYHPTQEDQDAHYTAALLTAYMFFLAWREGDPDRVRKQMAESLAQDQDFEMFETGYEQVSLGVNDANLINENRWDFKMVEKFRPLDADEDDPTLYSRYYLGVEYLGVGTGWKIVDFEELSDEDAPMM